jgi:glycosyltransferase involved in cell wall biosynthesis
MDALASCDLFVFPSPAEGFPKVILDAMAVGLPVIAAPNGQLASLARADMIKGAGTTPDRLAAAITSLTGADSPAEDLRKRGTAFCGAHTRPAEAARLVARWRRNWASLVGPD